jgi:SNF2 family DNA or RNA helicase
MPLPPLFESQQKGVDRWLEQPCMFNMSDPGTGKTRTSLEGIVQRGSLGRALVLAPLSILQPAWGNDIEKWTPHLRYSIAYAAKREEAFKRNSDIVIANHDAVKWIAENQHYLEKFDTIIVDEFTAFKNPTSQRTKALINIVKHFKYRYLLSGTPNPKSVLDLWSPAFILDQGERLGPLFFKFRADVCYPRQVGANVQAVQWMDKADSLDRVLMALDDVIYRVPLEGLPENREYTMEIELPKPLMRQYEELKKESVLALQDGELLTAAHAGARMKKLLQLLTGAVYDGTGEFKNIHTERYELVMQLVDERPQSVVGFNWRHERINLTQLAQKMDISYGVIDGEVSVKEREKLVKDFQDGKIRVLFCHPQSAGHGLTLTAGRATIWCSPTYNAEHYKQFNRRIFRTGQTERTETIRIAAKGTCEEEVYNVLNGKMANMERLLAAAFDISLAS